MVKIRIAKLQKARWLLVSQLDKYVSSFRDTPASLHCKSTSFDRSNRPGINHRNETGLRKCYREHPVKRSIVMFALADLTRSG